MSEEMPADLQIVPAIMCGGAGTRLWPLSTAARPKPFHPLGSSGLSLLQDTVLRVRDKACGVRYAAPILIGAREQKDQIAADMLAVAVQPLAVVAEPQSRSTTVVAALAASLAAELQPG